MALIIPNKVTNIHNNAGTYRPYNPGEAIGDLNPTIPAMPKPPKKKHGCGGIGAIIAAVVAVAVTAFTGNPMLGNIAGQVVGMATGAQKGFNFTSFATSVIAYSGGLPQVKVGNEFVSAAANAAISNVASQGIGIITGEQKSFSWASVAASAVGGAVGQSVGSQFKVEVKDGAANLGQAITKNVISNMAGNVASQLTQMALVGGKFNWTSVAVSGIQGVGSGFAEKRNIDLRNAQQAALGNVTEVKDQRLELRPDGKSPWGEGSVVAALGGKPWVESKISGEQSLYWTQRFSKGEQYVESSLFSGAQNGGLTFSNSTAEEQGVSYSDWQFMQDDIKQDAEKQSISNNTPENISEVNRKVIVQAVKGDILLASELFKRFDKPQQSSQNSNTGASIVERSSSGLHDFIGDFNTALATGLSLSSLSVAEQAKARTINGPLSYNPHAEQRAAVNALDVGKVEAVTGHKSVSGKQLQSASNFVSKLDFAGNALGYASIINDVIYAPEGQRIAYGVGSASSGYVGGATLEVFMTGGYLGGREVGPAGGYIGAAIGAIAYYAGYEVGGVGRFIDNTIKNGIINLPQLLEVNQGSVVIKHRAPTTIYGL
jgi:hypothetical protein